MMKTVNLRAWGLGLVLVLALVLAGCGSGEEPSEDDASCAAGEECAAVADAVVSVSRDFVIFVALAGVNVETWEINSAVNDCDGGNPGTFSSTGTYDTSGEFPDIDAVVTFDDCEIAADGYPDSIDGSLSIDSVGFDDPFYLIQYESGGLTVVLNETEFTCAVDIQLGIDEIGGSSELAYDGTLCGHPVSGTVPPILFE